MTQNKNISCTNTMLEMHPLKKVWYVDEKTGVLVEYFIIDFNFLPLSKTGNSISHLGGCI